MIRKSYNDIKDAKELVREVIAYGLSTDQEQLNRVADIIGTTQIGRLAEIANCKETINGHTIGEMFYFIAFRVWNWRQAVDFYNEHSNEDYKKFFAVSNEIKGAKEELADCKQKLEQSLFQYEDAKKQFAKKEDQWINAEKQLATARMEILILKAKLYDINEGALKTA